MNKKLLSITTTTIIALTIAAFIVVPVADAATVYKLVGPYQLTYLYGYPYYGYPWMLQANDGNGLGVVEIVCVEMDLGYRVYDPTQKYTMLKVEFEFSHSYPGYLTYYLVRLWTGYSWITWYAGTTTSNHVELRPNKATGVSMRDSTYAYARLDVYVLVYGAPNIIIDFDQIAVLFYGII